MVLQLSVKDIELNSNSTLYDNNVELFEKDIVSNLKLMKYLDSKKIYFFETLSLNGLELHFQNEIGTLFLESYGFTIEYDNKVYLNYKECRKLFANLDIILSFLNIAYNKTQKNIQNEDLCDIEYFSTKNYNLLILNFFGLKYRNYATIEKHIEYSDILFDINFDYGEYSKELTLTRFMLTHFLRYLSIKKDQIPFSNGFGSDIKNSIQKKNTDLTKNIIYEDINNFLQSLSALYNKSFKVVGLNLVESGNLSQKLTVNVFLQAAQEETIKITLEA